VSHEFTQALQERHHNHHHSHDETEEHDDTDGEDREVCMITTGHHGSGTSSSERTDTENWRDPLQIMGPQLQHEPNDHETQMETEEDMVTPHSSAHTGSPPGEDPRVGHSEGQHPGQSTQVPRNPLCPTAPPPYM
jgi:hypothetical protein